MRAGISIKPYYRVVYKDNNNNAKRIYYLYRTDQRDQRDTAVNKSHKDVVWAEI